MSPATVWVGLIFAIIGIVLMGASGATFPGNVNLLIVGGITFVGGFVIAYFGLPKDARWPRRKEPSAP